MELTNWAIEYVKARNAFTHTLKEHSVQGDVVTFVHKNKVHHFLCSEELVIPTSQDHYTVVCLNTERNVSFLIERWKDFLQPNLSVIFVNPAQHAHWQITPKVHSMVADEESLEAGIRSLASEVPIVGL